MINREATIRWKGYDPDDLKPNARARICVVCDECGRVRWVRKQSYRGLCRSCAAKKYLRNPENHPNWKGGGTIMFCKQCGKEMLVKPSVSDSTSFCSRKCAGKWRSENMHGENSPTWRGGLVAVTCDHCGREFGVYRSQAHRTRFCSRECFGRWQSENMRGENGFGWKGGNVVKICEQCGQEYKVARSRYTISRFCSRGCLGEWQSENQAGENAHNWMGGTSFEPYCPKFNEIFKESIREKFGRVCFLCPTTEEENGRKLCVHHVNYNKDCLCDDSDCEFVPLCNKCHTKTNHNREHWESLIMEKLKEVP